MQQSSLRRLLTGFTLTLLLGSLSPVRAAPEDFPEPPELEPAVHFWVRIYTEVGTNAGFLHDDENLAVVYDTLQFGPDSSPRSREQQVDAGRTRIAAALKRIAASPADAVLSPDDQHIKDLWGDAATPERLREAADHVRFQLGQADRFRQGLLRSGQWQVHIEEVLTNLGLPAELGVLPHVESSFNPAAYSKVGAAGLWQFMRSTGRRYMRIDSAVDDRMDPFRATEAAGQLLSYNHRLLGTWPLALTAYNHGAEGMRRAKEQVGSDDIVQILHNYHSPTFGFASRNFYVSFLAALTVDRNPQQYFGPIARYPEAKFQEVPLPAYVGISALERAVGIDAEALRDLNPALLPDVWKGRRRVPKDYLLRLPLTGTRWTSAMLAQSLRPGEMVAQAPETERRKVHAGETLARIAAEYGLSAAQLARANGMSVHAHLKPGRFVRVPVSQVSEAALAARSTSSSTPQLAATTSAPRASAPVVSAPVESSSGASAPASAATSATASAAASAPSGQQPVAPPAQLAATESVATSVSASASTAEEATDGAVTAAQAKTESAVDAQAVENAGPKPEPVSKSEAEAAGPALGPSAPPVENTDPTDYSVKRDGSVVVASGETLGHFAKWLRVKPEHLRQLNHLHKGHQVALGNRVKLDFARVSREQFEDKRREYHRQVQAAYFATHRISGTQVYISRAGDSIWSLVRRFDNLPPWLLIQYNPDVRFDELHPDTQITVPLVDDLTAAPGAKGAQ